MITTCRSQVRTNMGGAYALDFGAVLAMGEAMQADTGLLAEVLPAVEDAVIAALRGDDSGEDEGGADDGS